VVFGPLYKGHNTVTGLFSVIFVFCYVHPYYYQERCVIREDGTNLYLRDINIFSLLKKIG
jgi:hypothetical protein